MKAIRLNKPGSWEALEVSAPDAPLAPDEALINVKKIGVCGTDLHAFKGTQPYFTYPRILGHELAIEVVAVGDAVKQVKVGDLCAVEPYYNDGVGQAVRRGKPNCGEHLKVLGVHVDGGMRESFVYPAKFLHPSDHLSDDQLALIEPLAIGCHAVDRARMEKDDIVLVIGAGPIGLGAIQFAQLTGARVLAMDIDQRKLDKCTEITGIEEVLMATGEVEAELTEMLAGDLPTIILDATGNPQSMMKTFDYVAAGGTIVFIGLFNGDMVFYDPTFHKKELTLMASRAALSQDFSRTIQLVETGKLDPSVYITHRLKFDNVPSTFSTLYAQGSDLIKAIIEFS